jgi:hypothetical protein
VGKPEGKRPLGRPRRRLDNIKMDLLDIGWDNNLKQAMCMGYWWESQRQRDY